MTVTSQSSERKLAAIFAADIAGYSLAMSTDEAGTLATLASHRAVMDRLIEEHRGRIANTAGDSVLADFPSVSEAVRCAVAVQGKLAQSKDPVPLRFRIGIHLGDVVTQGADLLGDGVNLAARIQGIADPGGVCLSLAAYDQVRKVLPLQFRDLGARELKNIPEPVRAYAVDMVTPPDAVETRPALAISDKPSIAVLPFTNMSGDPEQEYFADGITEDIITALSRVRWFFVIARNSSFTYKGRAVDIRQVGRELGVRYVLEGSVRKSGNRLRITGQLIEAATGNHIWAEKYDGELVDIFDLQDRITRDVVGTIEPKLRNAEIQRSRRADPENLRGYHLYLMAIFHFREYTKSGFLAAEKFFRLAIDEYPANADAWAGLADCLGRMTLTGYLDESGTGPEETIRTALYATQLDPENEFAMAVAASSLAVFGGNLEHAMSFAERAIKINPNSSYIRGHCGWVSIFLCECDAGREHFEMAGRFDPADPRRYSGWVGMGYSFLFEKRFVDAASWALRAVELSPTFTPAIRLAIVSLAHLGRLPEAREMAIKLMQLQPRSCVSRYRKNNYKYPWMVELVVEGLLLAGLPE